MTYELVETLQEKDLNDNIIKIIARVNIHDDMHGIRAVNFMLMDNELLDILKFPEEEQKQKFMEWLEPKITEDHSMWISSITKPLEKIW